MLLVLCSCTAILSTQASKFLLLCPGALLQHCQALCGINGFQYKLYSAPAIVRLLLYEHKGHLLFLAFSCGFLICSGEFLIFLRKVGNDFLLSVTKVLRTPYMWLCSSKMKWQSGTNTLWESSIMSVGFDLYSCKFMPKINFIKEICFTRSTMYLVATLQLFK